MNPEKESLYYKTIVRCFLEQRGAPFFLTPQEIACLVSWEQNKVPLRIVLEGIGACFNDDRARRRKGKKKTSLLDCESYVLENLDMWRDRRVGGLQNKKKRDLQRKKLEKEAKRFLSDLPQDMAYLKTPFLRALEVLKSEEVGEDDLDKLETRVDDLIFRNAGREEIDQIREAVDREHAQIKGEERERLIRIRLIKLLRRKHRIPHLSLFYY